MILKKVRNDLEEVWKPISEYEGFYEVSNTGKVRSLDHFRKSGFGSYFMKGRELKQNFGNSGYLQVGLSKFGSKKFVMVHRLVAKTFLENKSSSCTAVNHKDGNKSNNNVSNLEWVTYSENQTHAYKNGLNRWVEGKGRPSKPVVKIELNSGKVLATYDSMGAAARDNGKSYVSSIKRCCENKTKSAYGFKWFYLEDYKKLISESEEE